ncbi:MAG: hypothetical protein KJZ86_20765 [Caldilineaceae bacterium]|nr:hypothetical protein [Caldilineaceae bacterium]HRJ42878.1 hypothetical protein [Caldilineaceae bacterium]
MDNNAPSQNKEVLQESGILYATQQNSAPSVESILKLVSQLAATDKLQLMESLVALIRAELAPPEAPVSLYGLWKGFSISEDDIAEARQEMWGNFPRDDI